jgi:hypothetical protein
MAVGLPLKTTYANGDVYSASDVNDTNGTINTTAAPFAAGKNKIINGDFYVNQRNFTSVTNPTGQFGFDRWLAIGVDGTVTYSAQTFTPGAAPVVGYEGTNFARLVSTGQTLTNAEATLRYRIEDVRTFANQTVTLSFWAKAASGTPSIAVEYNQDFGSGGSTRVDTNAGKVAITTSWARYSLTIAIPSISGKTIGTSSFLGLRFWTSAGSTYNARTGSLGIQSNTFDFWGVQVEAGSTATAFQTATGTIQGELAACQRYYVAWNTASEVSDARIAVGLASSTTSAGFAIALPVQMRVAPTTIDWTNTAVNYITAEQSITALAFTSNVNNKQTAALTATVASGLTANAPYFLSTRVSNRFGLGAEL